MNDDAERCSSRSDDVHLRLLQQVRDKAVKICWTEMTTMISVLCELGEQRLSTRHDHLG